MTNLREDLINVVSAAFPEDREFKLSKSNGPVKNTVLSEWATTHSRLAKELSSPIIGEKDGSYFIRCTGTKRANAHTANNASILILDGDSRIDADGVIRSGAPHPKAVHDVLASRLVGHCLYSSHSNAMPQSEILADKRGIDSGGLYGDDFHKYRVIIPCQYEREDLPALLDHLFKTLHDNGVMLAPVNENKSWSQPWFFPRVPDQQRLDAFKFYQFDGGSLDVEAITSAWRPTESELIALQPVLSDKPYKPLSTDSLTGNRSPIEEFNAAYDWRVVLERNGYEDYEFGRMIRPGSSSKIGGIAPLFSCKDRRNRFWSFGGDCLNDEKAHDAFDAYRLLECNGDFKKALNWNIEITQHNQRLFMQQKDSIQSSVDIDIDALTNEKPKQELKDINLDDDYKKLLSAIICIPLNAETGKTRLSAADIIGYALGHEKSGLNRELARLLGAEWDRLTGGESCRVFDRSSPSYDKGEPITTASIFQLAKANGWQQTTTKKEDAEDENFSFPKWEGEFYGLAGEVVELASKNSEVDPVAVYISFITSIAALVGHKYYINIGDYAHTGRLFSALVGATSRARKGSSAQPVKRIIKKAEEVYRKALSGDLNFYDDLRIADGGLSSAEGLIYQVRDQSEEATGKDSKPLWEGVSDKRFLIIEEELAAVFKVCQREGNTLSPILRAAWDHSEHKVLEPLTKSNRLKATNPHINILGHITSTELFKVLDKTEIHNGLINRFLWACVKRSQIIAFPERMDDSKVFQIAIKIASVMRKALNLSGDNSEITISPEAKDYWDKKYRQISIDCPGELGSATARNETTAHRLALIFAVLDEHEVIAIEHYKAAIDVINFSFESCRYLFDKPATDTDDGKKLLTALSTKEMTRTDISKLFGNNKTKDWLTALLDNLKAAKRIESIKVNGSKKVTWRIL